MMKKTMNLMVLSCKRATELIEKSQLFKLSFSERFRLKLHTSICDTCMAYKDQSKIIDKAIGQTIDRQGNEKHEFSKRAKGHLIKKISDL